MIAVLLLDGLLLPRAPVAFGPADVLVGGGAFASGPLQDSITVKTLNGSHRRTMCASDCFSHIVVIQQLDQTLT